MTGCGQGGLAAQPRSESLCDFLPRGQQDSAASSGVDVCCGLTRASCQGRDPHSLLPFFPRREVGGWEWTAVCWDPVTIPFFCLPFLLTSGSSNSFLPQPWLSCHLLKTLSHGHVHLISRIGWDLAEEVVCLLPAS